MAASKDQRERIRALLDVADELLAKTANDLDLARLALATALTQLDALRDQLKDGH